MKTLQKYSSFCYKQSLITDGRIILLDEEVSLEIQQELKSLKTVDSQELLFLDDAQLANETEEIFKDVIGQYNNMLFVFPGNGSCYPRKHSSICKKFYGADVYARRYWRPGYDPVVTTGLILPDMFLVMDVETVVVVDDVISSGLTMQKVHDNNAWRFTKAKWVGVSWVAQIPQVRAKSGVGGYEQIMTACVVGKNSGARAPINSISTLRQNQEIAISYARRHFSKPDTFLCLISK